MYLLDTNHVSKLLEGQSRVVDQVARIGSGNISVPFAVCGELIYMACKSQRREANLQIVHRCLQKVLVIHSDYKLCAAYADLKEAFIRRFGPRQARRRAAIRLHQIGTDENDLWIAAAALRHNLILVSADSDFERIRMVREFRLESWL